ncbi:uncharacterized protein LY89DRAFT_600049 [Mollisia scopiformis]|uniref:Uncharacterized protein n=1 Tax=Mollisia scopiformis TaxID=149040 RepID=A0A132B7N0_MOLSC|nr:uncharacterized protein LY89DRAFT_600049 [Mollisia scopiformis]KUJ08371.1 hypothetical protein LY89DRAFT_600049 [Mollisia scopiformis]
MISPLNVPRSVPDYIPSPHNSGSPSPNTQLSSQNQSHPISPPKTRSASAEEDSAALVEDWRAYTQKLRSQSEGERAHMAADRARMEEVMAEERALWDKERDLLKARILELEAELGKSGNQARIPHPITHRQPIFGFTSPGSNPVSVAGSIDSVHSRTVPQESGRNADGSPFYAPAPRNPSRTFDPSENTDLRVDDVHAPRETAICVTSKELTSSDFIQSPPSTHDLEAIHEAPAESIDISHIQPELEGVLIKASAVDPTFAAKVLSPRRSPLKLSPDIKPPPRDITNLSRSNSKEEKQKKTLEVVTQPENRRLTMHAGHTPNHSISKFSFLGADGESGGATPTQEHHTKIERVHRPSIAPPDEYVPETVEDEPEEDDHGDRELSGPLGLTTDTVKNDAFLEKLVEKLEEARKSADVSPSNDPEDSRASIGPPPRSTLDEDDDEKDDVPVLRLKPSVNFGRPLGSM